VEKLFERRFTKKKISDGHWVVADPEGGELRGFGVFTDEDKIDDKLDQLNGTSKSRKNGGQGAQAGIGLGTGAGRSERGDRRMATTESEQQTFPMLKELGLFEDVAPAKEQIWQSEMPFAFDDSRSSSSPAAEAAKFAKRFKVHHKMTVANGPSGGWPEFLFWGPRSNMEKLLKVYNKGAGLSKEEEHQGLVKSKRKYDPSAF